MPRARRRLLPGRRSCGGAEGRGVRRAARIALPPSSAALPSRVLFAVRIRRRVHARPPSPGLTVRVRPAIIVCVRSEAPSLMLVRCFPIVRFSPPAVRAHSCPGFACDLQPACICSWSVVRNRKPQLCYVHHRSRLPHSRPAGLRGRRLCRGRRGWPSR